MLQQKNHLFFFLLQGRVGGGLHTFRGASGVPACARRLCFSMCFFNFQYRRYSGFRCSFSSFVGLRPVSWANRSSTPLSSRFRRDFSCREASRVISRTRAVEIATLGTGIRSTAAGTAAQVASPPAGAASSLAESLGSPALAINPPSMASNASCPPNRLVATPWMPSSTTASAATPASPLKPAPPGGPPEPGSQQPSPPPPPQPPPPSRGREGPREGERGWPGGAEPGRGLGQKGGGGSEGLGMEAEPPPPPGEDGGGAPARGPSTVRPAASRPPPRAPRAPRAPGFSEPRGPPRRAPRPRDSPPRK